MSSPVIRPPSRPPGASAAIIDLLVSGRALRKCVLGLPERQAQAFFLVEVDEATTEEACKLLEVSATNLWVMLHIKAALLRAR